MNKYRSPGALYFKTNPEYCLPTVILVPKKLYFSRSLFLKTCVYINNVSADKSGTYFNEART